MIAAFFLAYICSLAMAQVPITLIDGQQVRGTVTPQMDILYQFDASAGSSFTFEVFPCSGAVDFVVALDRVPTTTDFDFEWRFPDEGLPEDSPLLFLEAFRMNNIPSDAVVYARVIFSTALNIFNGDQSPGFEAILTSEAPNPYPQVPVPSGLTLSNRLPTSVTARWNPSPSEASQDLQYCLYGHPEEGHLGTDLHGSACYSISQNEDFFGCTSDTTFTIQDIDAEAWHLDLVVIQNNAPMLSGYIGFAEIEEADESSSASTLVLSTLMLIALNSVLTLLHF